MRRMLRDILRQLGIRDVRDSNKVEEAMEMFQERAPDLVMSDWAPGLDGLGFLKKLRHDGANPYIPVILITANTESRHIYKALNTGMYEFLAKPITAARVYSRVCSVIEKRRMFISNEDFFGPDRRRARKSSFDGDNRRASGNINGPERRDGSETTHQGSNRRAR